METQVATLLAATSCSWHIQNSVCSSTSGLSSVKPSQAGSSPSVQIFSTWMCGATHSSLTAWKWMQVDLLPRLDFPLTSLSFCVCLRSATLFTSRVSAAFLRISPDPIFLSLFFDKQPRACSLPIHFIHILFPCKNACLLGLGPASSQHKQLLCIRSDYPTHQKSRRVQAAILCLSLIGLGGSSAVLTSRSRPAFQPSCSPQANSAPSVAIFFFLSPDESPARGTLCRTTFFFLKLKL